MTDVSLLISRRMEPLEHWSKPKFRDEIRAFVTANADEWYQEDPRLAGRLISLLSNNADIYGVGEYRRSTDEQLLALPGFGKRCLSLLRRSLQSDSPATS